MKNFLSLTKEFILDLLFPKFCLNCGKEENYLCDNCFSLIDILERQYCPFCNSPKVVIDNKTCSFCKRTKNLTGLYCAASYENFIIKKLVNQFKYGSCIKELSKPLSFLITAHFNALGVKFTKAHIILIPVPLYKKKQKQRGFNQAEEIGKNLSEYLKIPILNNVLIKTKQTLSQIELKKDQRKENIKGVFSVQYPELIKNQKILLIDDIFTTGSTMEECAKVLKEKGAKKVWGVVVARG